MNIFCTILSYGIWTKYGAIGLFHAMVISLLIVLLTETKGSTP